MTFDEQDITKSGVGPEAPSIPSTGEVKELNIPWQKVFLWLALGSSVVGALVATKTLTQIEKTVADAREAAKPASISVVKIIAPDCTDCFAIDGALEELKKQSVNVTEERTVVFDAPEGRELIANLSIIRIPTYVVKGEITKKSIEGFLKANGEIRNDQFIFTKITPIFVDPNTKKQVGRVAVTYLTDTTCSQCVDLTLTVGAYKKVGVVIAEERSIPWDSPEGKNIISRYAVEKIPTFLLSSDIALYENVTSKWQGIGTVEQDGTYVARELPLPYRDLAQGKIVGLVDIIYLVDASCTECYKPEVTQREILVRGFGVGPRSEKTVDVATAAGQALVSKYKIIQVPTILLSPDADQYATLKSAWSQVGTVEPDAWYVFRKMEQLGTSTYKDLSTNQVVRPPTQSPDASQGQ